MPTEEEKTQAQRNAIALMLHGRRSEDRGAELVAQISHLDLVPVVLILAQVAARQVIDACGGEDAAVRRWEQQLVELADRSD